MAGEQEKNIMRGVDFLMEKFPQWPRMHLFQRDFFFGGISLTGGVIFVTKPFTLMDKPHSHDFEQFWWFVGGNPYDAKEFGGVVEIYLNNEKYTLTTSAIVRLAPGVAHNPVIFAKVNKPFMFIDCAATPKYAQVGDKK